MGSFSRIKTYGDILLYQTHGDVEKSCFKLTTNLMPDVATILVYDSTKTSQKLNFIQELFSDVKQEFEYSFNTSNFSKEFIQSLKERMNKITLEPVQFSPQDYRKENYDGISSGDFFDLYSSMMTNYKKMLYSFVGEQVTPRIL